MRMLKSVCLASAVYTLGVQKNNTSVIGCRGQQIPVGISYFYLFDIKD